MSFSSELREAADALASRPELGAATPDLPRALRHIDGDDLVRLLRDAATLTRAVEKVRVIGAGILAERSARDMGQSGLAAKHGHRTPVEFVQSIGGVTRAEARRDVTLGASLLDGPGDEPGDGTGAGIDAPAPPDADRPQDWRAPLARGAAERHPLDRAA
ncbi:hypothetical protein [Microbacterium elymi]|uniref:DUF222 domain-containing protein n=1 Tax=Microbacterium elymi TaxID=2909587 RepID=A0ABY5NGV4_9MICO|nr:hypothetical protein [Microbacterium elymi]UUT34390.1 hypothetical protein L2X98_27635 [Microbacterium elymi]